MATILQPSDKTDRWVDDEGRLHKWNSQTWTQALDDPQLVREWGWVYHERQTHRIEQQAQGTAEEQIKEQQVAVKQGVRTLRVKWYTSLKRISFGPPGSGAEHPDGRTTVDEHWSTEHDFGESRWIPHVAPSPAPLPTTIPVSTPSTGLTPTPLPTLRHSTSGRRAGSSSASRQRHETPTDFPRDDDESDATVVDNSDSGEDESDVEIEELKRQLRKAEEAKRNKGRKRSAQAPSSKSGRHSQSQTGGGSGSRRRD
ncbi:hypothetical protein AC578_4121 [Pseudocercospora eumusae]|uniref:Uncharacterized protein n=1 Tax=Pseudocercospora eumusae TaxID=321146 RepID=A0A139HF93_9PEZI|nr:hypothetical protein AC578_4121 [Pseudocercospora eumusae]